MDNDNGFNHSSNDNELIHPIRNTQELLSRLFVVLPEIQNMMSRMEEANSELKGMVGRSNFLHICFTKYSDILSDYIVVVLNKIRRNPHTGEPIHMKVEEVSELKNILYKIMQIGLQLMPYITSFISMLMSVGLFRPRNYMLHPPRESISSEESSPNIVEIEEIDY